MTGYFYLAMCLLCLLTIIMLKITYGNINCGNKLINLSTEKRYSLYKTRWLWIEIRIFLQNESIQIDSRFESNRFESRIGMLYRGLHDLTLSV